MMPDPQRCCEDAQPKAGTGPVLCHVAIRRDWGGLEQAEATWWKGYRDGPRPLLTLSLLTSLKWSQQTHGENTTGHYPLSPEQVDPREKGPAGSQPICTPDLRVRRVHLACWGLGIPLEVTSGWLRHPKLMMPLCLPVTMCSVQ